MKLKFISVCLLLLSIGLFSCSQDDEIFSCDKDANQWVKSNLAEIKQMTNADFLKIGNLVYQRAAFNALSQNQRQSLWIEKLINVLKLDWTEQESQFIESLLEFVKTNPFIFSKEHDPKDLEKVEIEYYRWGEYAYEELKWERKLLAAVVGTPHNLSGNKEIELNLKSFPTAKNESEAKCECSQGIGDFCMQFWTMCCIPINSGCDKVESDCGWFWGQECNGLCTNPLHCQ